MQKKVTIDNKAGFCFGVVNAIETAEKELDKGEALYCLGDIVHNNMEVERLKQKGLIIINHEQFKTLKNAKVLIRAHGEPPQTYQIAKENNITIIDASCKVVLKLQRRIKTAFNQENAENSQIVIYGKKGHAEVVGLEGQTNNSAIVVSNVEDLEKIDFTKDIILFSQTTQSIDGLSLIINEIKQRLYSANNANPAKLIANDTICRQVSNRVGDVQKMAKEQDVIIFVSGKESSNGMFLYKACQSVNPKTYFISSVDELKNEWFENIQNVGISGATSTPMWLMKQISEAINKINN